MSSIDVVMCIDRMHFVGIVPTIRSIVANTARPHDLAFHVAVGRDETDELQTLLADAFPDPAFRCELTEFHGTPFLDDYIRAGKDFTYAAYSSSVMNFARFYLAGLFADLGKYAYLDVDLIVQGDLAELFEEATLEAHDLAAVRIASFGTWGGGFKDGSEHLQSFDADEPIFNNGIYVTDLARWQKVLPRLEHWMRIHRRSMDEFVFGTQSIMNLAFYRNLQVLAPEWNVRPLGYRDDFPDEVLRQAKILHWAGERKPWKEDGLYKEYWRPWT